MNFTPQDESGRTPGSSRHKPKESPGVISSWEVPRRSASPPAAWARSTFGYDQSLDRPLRVGFLGTGDEGSVLLGAVNPDYIDIKAIADIRPYNVFRAFHGDEYSPDCIEAPHRVDAEVRLEDGRRGAEARQRLQRLPRSVERRDGHRGGDHRPAVAPARPGGHRRDCRPATTY